MAASITGLYMIRNHSTLHLKHHSRRAEILRGSYAPKYVGFKNHRRSDDLYRSPLLWIKTLGRRTVACNFFRQSVDEEDRRNDKDERKSFEENAEKKRIEDEGRVEEDRPPFDLNLAVVLAGFAFEAYSTPQENTGIREVDAGESETVFLSEHFLHEVYDGQLFVKLKKGFNLPAMDPWGTSDPYVVMELGDCVVKGKIMWVTKEPNWNESFAINVKEPSTKYLQVAAWDANIVIPHKRIGNAGVKLESLCDGKMHEIQVELEGIGGGGVICLELNYKRYEEIRAEESGWRIPFFSDIVLAKGLETAFKTVFGTESVKVRDFVLSSFGQVQPLLDIKITKNNQISEEAVQSTQSSEIMPSELDLSDKNKDSNESGIETQNISMQVNRDEEPLNENDASKENIADDKKGTLKLTDTVLRSEFDFWKNLADNINQTVEGLGINKVNFHALDNNWWNGNEMIKKLGLQSQNEAEEQYVESGLATPKQKSDDDYPVTLPADPGAHSKDDDYPVTLPADPGAHSKLMDAKQASHDVLRETETILGSLMMLTASLAGHKSNANNAEDKDNTSSAVDKMPESASPSKDVRDSAASPLTSGKMEEMKRMFSTAESAMEAWAMLATALGRSSFIKSEFEKICFLDNRRTDTQVALWRDSSQQRLVVAFRGTEQVRWKDLRTDLMLAPTGLNPERVGGDFKEEVQVHSGFLSAYDSVRNRLLSFIKTSIGFMDGDKDMTSVWHVYVTGHSLGGALATLLALELSSSHMAKHGCIKITMYNFGSPRVGNKRFAEEYNKRVKDSWRIVNHRDIIPTVPRLMGYCHVAQPVYFTAGDLHAANDNLQIQVDEYQGDVIGESTPDTLFSEFMKGEKQLIDRLIQTEINLFRAIRDGTALMQHMEDFYYITLLQCVRSRIMRR